jgi:GT2 family glycosyltransferase
MTGASAADLAVVIVNFNTGDWLARCLRSLRPPGASASTCSSWTTTPVTERKGAEAPGVRLIRNPSNRYLAAWNQGAATPTRPTRCS